MDISASKTWLTYRTPAIFLVRTISSDSSFLRQHEISDAAIFSFQISMGLQGDASKLPHVLFYQPRDLNTQDWISMLVVALLLWRVPVKDSDS